MLLRVAKARWLVLPLAAFFILSSSGAAAAPDCHTEKTLETNNQSVPTHNHSGISHDLSHHAVSTVASGFQGKNDLTDKGLEKEICFILGFITLFLFQFFRMKRSAFKVEKISQPRFILPEFLSKHLSHLNLTHLQLGIIRI